MITLQTTQKVPNSVYVPQFMIQTGINNGQLITSCQIVYAAAKVISAGLPTEQWVPTGQNQMIYIPDLNNLDPDLAKYQTQVTNWYNNLVAVLEAFNSTRKVL